MCKKSICSLAVLLICVFMMSCGRLPVGLNYDIEGLPSIDEFSGTEYEDYKNQFPPVESAQLIKDGEVTVIEPDDPRLIRLLNFLACSDMRRVTVWRQGYVEKDEIDRNLACDAPMLVVNFGYKERINNYTQENTPQIIVCRDCYLIVVNHDNIDWAEEGEVCAECLWPYASLFGDFSSMISDSWGEECWIDILEYAGFYTE